MRQPRTASTPELISDKLGKCRRYRLASSVASHVRTYRRTLLCLSLLWYAVCCVRATPAAASSTVIVTFDNPAPSGSSTSLLNGVFQGINFGTGNWRWEGAWASDPTNNVYFASSTGTSRQFAFSGGPQILNSLHALTDTRGTLTLTDNLGQTKQQTIQTGPMQLVTTGWTRASTTITVAFSKGWSLAIDDITYSAPVGLNSPALSVSPASLSFGSVNVGSASAPQAVTLSNGGAAGAPSVTVSQAVVTGTGFSITGPSLPLTLAAGQSASLSVTFAPTAGSSVAGSVTVTSNASNSPAVVTLSGTGVMPQLTATPASVSFGSVNVGTSSSPQTVTLANGGGTSVTISQAAVSGAGFTVSGLPVPLTLAAGQKATFSATFAPTKAGVVAGSVSIVSNASNSPASVALSGTGNAAQLATTPSSTAFGNVLDGNSSTLPVTLQNTGTSSLTISQANVAGTGFSVSGLSVPLTLAASQTASFSVTFAPTVTGSVAGSVSLVSNALNSPTTESLSGTGVKSHSAVLSWTASTSTGVAGYNVYRAMTSGGPYTEVNPALVTGTSYTDSAPQAGQTYYYVATSVDSNNAESVYSSQVTVVVPSP